MAWENLPMRDRATIIKLGVQSGLRDINSIKETYNKFADGGRVNRKFKWDKVNKGTTITNPYGETYYSGDNTRGLFQQTEDNSWTPVSVEQARDIYVPNVTDPVSNSYTQLGPMPTLTVTSPDWETVPYNVEDTRFGGRTPITNINVRRNKNTGKILSEDYRQALAIKDWYAKQHPKSDPSENALNDAVFTALTLGANKNLETTTKGISSLVSKVDPVIKTSFREGIAKPILLGSLVDQTQKAVTGTSLSDQIGNWLTNDYSWNPYVAHFIGDLTNPGYTMPNFTGQFLTKEIINPIITGISNTERNVVKRQLIRELNKSISKFDGTVGEEYFRSPDNWYRVTESPEIESLREMGHNITTTDLLNYNSNAGRFYNFVYEHKLKPGIGENEGYFILPKKENKPIRFRLDKFGSAHGNTSQAAKGNPWNGNTTRTLKFPTYILEGRGNKKVYMGLNRTDFVLTPWEEIPMGGRVGFHTKEMPMEGLNMFRALPNGRYKIEGELLPDKRIFVDAQEPGATGGKNFLSASETNLNNLEQQTELIPYIDISQPNNQGPIKLTATNEIENAAVTKPFAISNEPFQYRRGSGYRKTFGDFIFTSPLLNQKPSIWQRIFKYKPHSMTIKELEKEAPGLFNEDELSWMKLPKQERNEIMTNAVQEFYEENIYPNLIRNAKQFGYTQDVIPKNVFYGETPLGNNLPLEEGHFSTKNIRGAHGEISGKNYVSGEIVRWSPRFIPYKLMQLWDKSRGTSIKHIRSRYIVPQKDESILTAIHEAGSHGTDNLTIYNKSPFGKSLYDMLDFRVHNPKNETLSPWEVRATINEFKVKNPNWREMTFDDFIKNRRDFINANSYARSIYTSAYLNKKLDRLYNAIMNTYATGGKLNKNNINDNTRVTNKQLVLSIEDDPNISIIRRVNSSPADFVQRLKDPNRKVIKLPNGQVATHKMGWATVDRRPVVFPLVQNINGKLVDFENKGWAGLDSAINRGDTIHMTSPQEAEWFTTHYKDYYPSFKY